MSKGPLHLKKPCGEGQAAAGRGFVGDSLTLSSSVARSRSQTGSQVPETRTRRPRRRLHVLDGSGYLGAWMGRHVVVRAPRHSLPAAVVGYVLKHVASSAGAVSLSACEEEGWVATLPVVCGRTDDVTSRWRPVKITCHTLASKSSRKCITRHCTKKDLLLAHLF